MELVAEKGMVSQPKNRGNQSEIAEHKGLNTIQTNSRFVAASNTMRAVAVVILLIEPICGSGNR
jgi:hypothetical protein